MTTARWLKDAEDGSLGSNTRPILRILYDLCITCFDISTVASPKPQNIPASLAATPNATKGAVTLKVAYGVPNFRWQMVFNAFTIEKVSNGTLLRVAYVAQNTAAEIVPILICTEGLQQLLESSRSYIKDFGSVEPYPAIALPQARQFSPLFSNNVRLSHSGSSAEIAFYTVPLSEIAQAAKGKIPVDAAVNCVQVALLHSDITIHKQLTLALVTSL